MSDSETEVAPDFSRLLVLVVGVWSFWPLLIAPFNWGKCTDDMYITFTYARSLAAGDGFVFNHPPATLGTTTPFMTMVLAVLGKAIPGDAIPQIGVVLTALSWSMVVWLIFLFRAAFGLKEWQGAIVGAVILAGGAPDYLGFENFLFAALFFAAVGLMYAKHPLPAGVLTGFLFLTRGEGVLLLPFLILAAILVDRKRDQFLSSEGIRSAAWISAGFLMVFGAWTLYALPTFGSILPNTLAAKLAQQEAGLFGPWAKALFVEQMPQWERHLLPAGWPLVLNPWWILTVLGLIYVVAKHQRWLIFFGWLAAFVCGYAILRVPNYPHYQEIPRFFLLPAAGFGLIALVELALKVPMKYRQGLVTSAACITFLFLAGMFVPRADAAFNRLGDTRQGPTRALGEWLKANSSPDETVAYIEIGFLAYFSGNKILDLAGLTDPEGVSHIKKNDYAWSFFKHMPEFYVDLDVFDYWTSSIKNSREFNKHYRLVKQMRSHIPSNFKIFARNDVAQRLS